MACCFRTGSTFSDSIEVPVAPDVLWATVADLEALPRVVGAVQGFERVSGTTKLPGAPTVGTRFREIRMHRDKEIILHKTVTRVEDDNPQERSLSLGIAMTNADGTNRNIVNTSTLIVKPSSSSSSDGNTNNGNCGDENDKDGNHKQTTTTTSTLFLIIAFQWNGLLDHLYMLSCRPCLNTVVRNGMTEELDDYRRAAIELSRNLLLEENK